MKKLKTIRNQDGISLIEVLVAMILMAFSLMLLLNMAMVALDGNYWSNKTTIATQIMQEKLEQLRASGVSNMKNGKDTAQGLVRSWKITTAGKYLRQIDVEIEWDDIQARTHTNKMTAWVRSDSV